MRVSYRRENSYARASQIAKIGSGTLPIGWCPD
jgi:hypothetical protein